MTKSELIEQVSEMLKLPNGKAEHLVNCIFDSMVMALQEGDGIEIRGFGSFTVREYKSYEGRNPRTGEMVHVAPKRLPFFKVGKDLRERVNDGAGKSPMPGERSLDDLDDDDDDDDLYLKGGRHDGHASAATPPAVTPPAVPRSESHSDSRPNPGIAVSILGSSDSGWE